MALALDARVVRPGEVFDCSGGVLQVGSRRIREDDHHDYRSLTAAGVLARSSNVGIVKVGQRLGRDRLYDGVRLFGFGTRTLDKWPGETPGLVRPRNVWTDVWTLPSVSFGQEISSSPAQLLAGYGVLAAGGVHRPLRVVADEPPRAAHRVVSERAVAEVTPMLEEVLISGTGRRVAIPDYSVAGKTGTAQKFVDGVIVGHTGAFGCYAPADAPRLVVLVLCDRPKGRGHGGTVAAPYAMSLLRKGLHYLGVPARTSVSVGSTSASGEQVER
jgi:cell division protein FtsI (penicillin-binding protein 3)